MDRGVFAGGAKYFQLACLAEETFFLLKSSETLEIPLVYEKIVHDCYFFEKQQLTNWTNLFAVSV